MDRVDKAAWAVTIAVAGLVVESVTHMGRWAAWRAFKRIQGDR